ncbi:MAG: hypothetical protein Q8P67_01050, partial [archaeon]|nr:hypothetical protein [archaeon]
MHQPGETTSPSSGGGLQDPQNYVRWTSRTSGLIQVEPKFESPVWLTHKNYMLPAMSRGVVAFEARGPHNIGISLNKEPLRVIGGDRVFEGSKDQEKPSYEIVI